MSGVPVRAILFDLGETLLDETRMWDAWADRLGVPRFTFHALAGAGISRGDHPSTVITLLASVFFARAAAALDVEPAALLSVGDRLDNDVFPAQEAGCRGALLRRGPWGILHARLPEVARADLLLDSLAELPGALANL